MSSTESESTRANPERDWRTKARDAARNGADGLSQLLDTSARITAKKYLEVLQLLYDEFPPNTHLICTVFDCLQNNIYYHQTKPEESGDNWTIAQVREERSGWDRQRPRLSFYDLFEVSIRNWERGTEALPSDPDLECSPLTRIIWDHGKDELWDGGAIFACAQHGLRAFLDYLLSPEALGRFATSEKERLQKAFLSGPSNTHTSLGIAIRGQHLECVNTLLGLAGAGAYIRKGNVSLVDSSTKVPVLHKALDWAQADIGQNEKGREARIDKWAQMVEKIILAGQVLLTQYDERGDPPYQRALKLDNVFKSSIISDVIRKECFSLESLEDVRRALYNKKGKELGLDLSDFNYQADHFAKYVDELQCFSEELDEPTFAYYPHLWEFEDTLVYLNIPNLKDTSQQEQGKNLPEHVSKFLAWLRTRGVKNIKTFKLPDHDAKFDSDFIVREVLQRFTVEGLDWVRLDADIAELARKCLVSQIEAPQVLNMYFDNALGIRDTSHAPDVAEWLNEIGTIQATPVMFARARTIPRNITLSPDHTLWEDYDGFQVQKPIFEDKWCPDQTMLYRPTSEERPFLEDELRDCHDFLNILARWPEKRRCSNPRTDHCLTIMRQHRVKIALIDNGVDRIQDPLHQIIERGTSFVKAGGRMETSYLPWFTPADSHGTQMADLIQQTNRWCRLYPVRVGSLQRDIDAKAAAEAIEWSIEQGVDIISMSWVITRKVPELEAAIRKAAKANILLFCSTADIGKNSGPLTFPANYDNVISVSAADKFGGRRNESAKDVHLMFQGEEIPAKGPCFMGKGLYEQTSGSSVATALAAGLASLCLFLARMARDKGSGDNLRDRLHMLGVFHMMQADKSDRLLVPSRIFGDNFACDPKFSTGAVEPPKGLQRFDWNLLNERFAPARSKPFGGELPRRNRSKTRVENPSEMMIGLVA